MTTKEIFIQYFTHQGAELKRRLDKGGFPEEEMEAYRAIIFAIGEVAAGAEEILTEFSTKKSQPDVR